VSDLSGHWDGTYAYPSALQPISFHAELRDSGRGLTGEVVEPSPDYLPPGEMVAVITGNREGSSVHFTKIYDSLEHFLDPVFYDGVLDDEECEISGTWTITPGWSGTFVMTRPKTDEAEEEAQEEVEVDR
jgi:hypothetical protein